MPEDIDTTYTILYTPNPRNIAFLRDHPNVVYCLPHLWLVAPPGGTCIPLNIVP
jgi:hypothetical protein